MSYSNRELREGRQRLKQWVPKIRKATNLRDVDNRMEPRTAVGSNIMSRVTFKNLDALVIYQTPDKSGWHADLIMTGLPVGVGNVFGTPTSMPCESREAALKAGTFILKGVVRACMENEMASRDMAATDSRYFELHGHAFELPGVVIDAIFEAFHSVPEGTFGDLAEHQGRLRTNLETIMGAPDSFDEEKWDSAPEDQRMKVIANMATLLIFGEFRFPKPSPKLEEETSPDGP